VPKRTRVLLWSAGATIVALVAVIAILVWSPRSTAPSAAGATPTPTPTATDPTIAELYQAVGPSVVVIRTAAGALGSGVVIATDGTVLTANHVIADGSAITVTFSDGTESGATVSSADTATDTAALLPARLPQLLVPATIGGGVATGDEVIAIGNPLGLTYSVSSGIVSATDRTETTEAGEIGGLIQFDAAVNPGSSGGPLVDDRGFVVGIVLAIADPGHDEAWAGIGFAVPIGSALSGGGGRAPQL